MSYDTEFYKMKFKLPYLTQNVMVTKVSKPPWKLYLGKFTEIFDFGYFLSN